MTLCTPTVAPFLSVTYLNIKSYLPPSLKLVQLILTPSATSITSPLNLVTFFSLIKLLRFYQVVASQLQIYLTRSISLSSFFVCFVFLFFLYTTQWTLCRGHANADSIFLSTPTGKNVIQAHGQKRQGSKDQQTIIYQEQEQKGKN